MRRSDRKRSRSKVGLIVALAILVVLVAGYAFRSTYYSSRFLPNTVVNGIEIENLTVEDANKKMEKALSDTPFVIQIDGKDWKAINRQDLGWTTDYAEELSSIKGSQNPFSWGMQLVSAAETTDVSGNTLDEDKLNAVKEQVKVELAQVNEPRTPTENATIKQTESGFEIVAEKQGTTIDVDSAADAFAEAVSTGKHNISMNEYLSKPTTKKDDPQLKESLEEMNKVSKVKATYSINGNTIDIPSDNIHDWLTVDAEGKLALDQEKVTAYVTELGQTYNTSTQPTKFNSTRRGEVEVPAGAYSWTIQPEEEAAALSEQILQGKDFTRSPIVDGSTTADKALIGNTYVEVDLQNQHMWVYKDGAVALETDIVSGKPSSPTPPGVNYVWSKERNTTLRGLNDDGSKYASPVSYWMPIDWTGVGIHDSDWQSAYGGDLWLTRGSHGCINTPPGVMGQVFDLVDVGTPVLVF
ncbi:L,D-transpeptidase family protein [Enterococcus sp. 669A]|uniref:L,D-transpeptidase family protein n=1 Tax=Candidatus Enterococcus moelleringii TaxID=2815325 RepID=A0ABS3L5I6_9ENTE|nr:L,D-transpeptidase family protein [Enterococcus sp. 669A]MBO1304873.1 L,D-transpeptidase family protein [Enterococcus sp. 669A]